MANLHLSALAVILSIAVAGPGFAQAPSVADCLARLAEPDVFVSAQARHQLGPDGPFRKLAVPALLEALGEKESRRDRIVPTLADHGADAVPGLLAALRGPNARTRAGVAEALAAIRPRPAEVVPALIRALDDSEPEVRQVAVKELGKVRRRAAEVVPPLLAKVRDSDEQTRAEVVTALGRMTRAPGPALTAVTAALKDKDVWVRIAAAEALTGVGPAVESAAPALIDALRVRREDWEHASIAWALTKAGPAAAPAVPQLVELLKSKDDRAVRAAARALGAIGPAAKAAVPQLLDLAKDEKHPEQLAAVDALGAIGPAAKAAVPLFTAKLRADLPDYERGYVVEALGGIGPDAIATVPTLVAIARDRRVSASLRGEAATAVARIDPAAAKKEKLEYAHLDVRLGEVAKVAIRPRPAATPEQAVRVKALIAALADTNGSDAGLSATMTGSAFAPLPDRARFQMGMLTAERHGPSDAFRTLVELGPDALPFLLAALDDPTPTRVKVDRTLGGFFAVGGHMPAGNPFNAVETKARARKPAAGEEDEDDDHPAGYRVKVGDVCFVALGQIVGRPYAAVRYIPSGNVSVNSVSESREAREQLRAAWGGPDPAKGLLASLLTDFATEGVFNGSSLDGWDEGSRYQVEAAVRLLYYFPDDAGPVLAARLKGLDVVAAGGGDGGMLRDVRNRVRTIEFIRAVGWAKAGPVRDALADVVKRTDDPAIRRAAAADKK
ncbi:HEAT repeat domain-containing protein [Limnoglobus roseus]|uniref:HEAT repeat domain-containing protein n=1 Tax=Limnoglobus roseus TaxID=2598579 RepID=A0A5C1ARN9_9BACT|nr:HEAT repeat domain-containing protein [Limnoglobus roseus]QEL20686.1 HEAT repeat domain-containing protein [Limnoglobus roseus]